MCQTAAQTLGVNRATPFPMQAKAAFNAAANIWANILQSSVPITIQCLLGEFRFKQHIGIFRRRAFIRDFTGAPRANTWYAGSLANALAGSDLDPS